MAISAWLKWPKLIVPDVNTTAAPIIDYISLRVEHQSVEERRTEQPHFRTVVDFLARNIAQLGLQAFERQDDGGRERVRDSTLRLHRCAGRRRSRLDTNSSGHWCRISRCMTTPI